VGVREEMLRKEAEIRDLMTDVSEHGLVIENKEKRIEELENDVQFNLNQIEKLELKLVAAGEEIKSMQAKAEASGRLEEMRMLQVKAEAEVRLEKSKALEEVKNEGDVSLETLERIRAVEGMSEDELVVSSKAPVKAGKIKKSSSTRSGSMLTAEKIG